MPLLTITNLLSSPIAIQDLAGSISLTVPGSGTITNKPVTEDQLAGLEAPLNAEQTLGNLRWTAIDNPTSVVDGTPSSPAVVDRSRYFASEDDFVFAAGATLALPGAKTVQGSATGDFVANTAGGVYSLATAAVSEAEAAQYTWNDLLLIDPTKTPIFEARVAVNFPGSTIVAALERWVVGLASAHATGQASLDNVVSNVWFRGEGANLNITVEGDDGTTDTDDRDTLVDYVKNTFMLLRIDMTDLTKVAFYVNGVKAPVTVSVPLLSSSTLLQPIFCFQRDSGVTVNQLKVDWYRVYGLRT
jgi:hypothetical protein